MSDQGIRQREKFWVISFQLAKKRRWYLDANAEYADWWWQTRVTLWGDVLQISDWPSPPPIFAYNMVPITGVTDTTESISSGFIVSTRLRAFFEAEAPGALAFYPIRLQGPGSEDLPPYFAAHFLKVWDCLHPYAWDEDENGRYIAFPVLDPEKIPADALIGSVKHYEVLWLIHDSLKRKIKKQGLTGFDFYQRAPFMASDDAPMFTHVNNPRDPDGAGGGTIESSEHYQQAKKNAANPRPRPRPTPSDKANAAKGRRHKPD